MKMAKNLQKLSEFGKQIETFETKDHSVILQKLFQFFEELFSTKVFLNSNDVIAHDLKGTNLPKLTKEHSEQCEC